MLFRIYTENVNTQASLDIVSSKFPGFTYFENAKGYYQGTKEDSLVIEITAPLTSLKEVREVAKRIKKRNSQETVLIQILENSEEYV